MLSIISMLVSRLVKDPLLQSIIMLFIANCYSYGSKLAEPAMAYIQQAAGLPLTNSEKLLWVVAQLKNDFPGIGVSFIKTIVEATYDKWIESKNSK